MVLGVLVDAGGGGDGVGVGVAGRGGGVWSKIDPDEADDVEAARIEDAVRVDTDVRRPTRPRETMV